MYFRHMVKLTTMMPQQSPLKLILPRIIPFEMQEVMQALDTMQRVVC